jgi:hypothetical protein
MLNHSRLATEYQELGQGMSLLVPAAFHLE